MTENPDETASSGAMRLEQQVASPPVLEPLPDLDNSPVLAPEPSTKLLSLDPASVTAERVAGWIFTLVVLVIGLGILVGVGFSAGWTDWLFLGCAVAYLLIAAGLVWLTHFFPKLQHDHAGWRLTSSGLEIHRGVWWRSQINVPLARVQHTDVHQGPLLRRFGLAKLIVHTAGTENSAVELAGLSFETAQRLRDALIENRGGIDGV